MINFVKALSKDRTSFINLCQEFSSLSLAELKENLFTELDLRILIPDSEFDGVMNGLK